MAVVGIRCPKCGLQQMVRQTCKSCGAALHGEVPSPRPPGGGMANRQAYGGGEQYSTHVTATADVGTACCECGNTFSQDEVIRYGDSWVCAICKPVFIQKLKEGARLPGVMEYGGFWIRLVAKFIDGLVLWLVNLVMGFLVGFFVALVTSPMISKSNSTLPAAVHIFLFLMQFVIPAIYVTWFLGKYGATPGKMACKLQVVTSDGGQITYARACGRHFAEMLSAIILAIGYLMAAFDNEKRTLHDRICNTRVVKV